MPGSGGANAGHRLAGQLWARSELRRRWRALVVLGLLAGLSTGLASAAVAGARRSDASWERLRQVSLASDAIVFASQAGIDDPDWTPIANLPYVVASGAFSFGNAAEGDLFVNQYGDWLTKVDRPRVLQGRLPNPDDPHEVVVERRNSSTDPATPNFDLGQVLHLHLLNQEQAAAGPTDGPPAGREGTFRVVGITESPFTMVGIPSASGVPFAGPAFRKAYPDSVQVFSNLLVRLRDPKHDIRRLEADVAKAFPGRGVPVYDLGAAAKRVTNGTGLETTGLFLFALAVAAAGTVVVGQALTRSVRAASGDLGALSAIGFDRRGAARALALPHLVSAATAIGTAVVTAVALSPRFPIGLGRRVDPDVGLHVDLPIVAGAALVVGLLLAAAVLATAWRASGPASGTEDRTSSVVSAVTRLGLPLPVLTGARLALEPGRGRRSLPTRSALIGAAVGVLGLVGALLFLHGLDDAAGHAERFGSNWQVEASFYGREPDDAWRAVPKLFAADRDVDQVAAIGRLQAPVNDLVVPFYAIVPSRGRPLQFSTIEGRRPERSGEVALGPDTADVLHVHVGDEVSVGDGHRLQVVGLALFPTTPHSSFDQGAWIQPDDLTTAFPMSVRRSLSAAFEADLTDDAVFRQAFFVLGNEVAHVRNGVDAKAVLRRLQKKAGETVQLAPPSPSADQQSMHNVRSLPILFGLFAPLVALGGLLHVSSSVLRRRGTDLAVLRAIGITPRQAGACIAWQATVLAGLGLVVGGPLGYIVGRTTWKVVAEHTPMVTVIPPLTAGLLLVVPAVLLAANLAGARPAWRAARSSPVERLRAD